MNEIVDIDCVSVVEFDCFDGLPDYFEIRADYIKMMTSERAEYWRRMGGMRYFIHRCIRLGYRVTEVVENQIALIWKFERSR